MTQIWDTSTELHMLLNQTSLDTGELCQALEAVIVLSLYQYFATTRRDVSLDEIERAAQQLIEEQIGNSTRTASEWHTVVNDLCDTLPYRRDAKLVEHTDTLMKRLVNKYAAVATQ